MPSHLSLSFPTTKLKTHHTCTLLFLFPFCYNGGRFPPQSLNFIYANRFHLFFSQNNQRLLWLSSLYFLCHISPYSLCSGHNLLAVSRIDQALSYPRLLADSHCLDALPTFLLMVSSFSPFRHQLKYQPLR